MNGLAYLNISWVLKCILFVDSQRKCASGFAKGLNSTRTFFSVRDNNNDASTATDFVCVLTVLKIKSAFCYYYRVLRYSKGLISCASQDKWSPPSLLCYSLRGTAHSCLRRLTDMRMHDKLMAHGSYMKSIRIKRSRIFFTVETHTRDHRGRLLRFIAALHQNYS